MATLKVTTINLTGQLGGSNVFTVKLDAWRQTFYYICQARIEDILLLDGLNIGNFAHERESDLGARSPFGPFVMEFGGAHYRGKPIQLDDQITFTCRFSDPEARPGTSLLCVKQYFVEDRPGPDSTIEQQERRMLPAQRPLITRAPGAARPRIPAKPLTRR